MCMCLGILPEIGIILGGLSPHGFALPERCELLQAVHKTFQAEDDWIILSRREHPDHQEWSVVATYAGSDDARITSDSIVVFESVAGVRGLTVSHGIRSEFGACTVDPGSLGSSRFVHQLRGDLDYRIRAFQTPSPRDVVRVVRTFLDGRVRELKQPDILLTSTLSSAD